MEGVTNVKEMQRHLKRDISTSQASGKLNYSNKRFFPRDVTVSNHIQKAISRNRESDGDQECLLAKIELWRQSMPESFLFFRPKGQSDATTIGKPTVRKESNKLLFVFQHKWQRRLLKRYGEELFLLDATHNTTKYSLPLFFIVVKTNVDYQVVGVIVCEDEQTETILEALSIIKEWNPTFKPTFAMTDYCKEEITAIETVFPGMQFLYLCIRFMICVQHSRFQ